MRPIVVSLALTTGCLFGGGQMSIRDQIKQGITVGDSEPGKVDRTALATGELVHVETPMFDGKPMLMQGIIGDELCFDSTRDYSGAFSYEEVTEGRERLFKSVRYLYQTLDSLDEITAATPWPVPPATNRFDAESPDVSFEEGTCTQGVYDEKCTMGTWHAKVGFCTPVPQIPPTARYLALFIIGPYSKGIVICELTGEAPPAVAPDAETDLAETPPAEDAPAD